MNQPELDTMFGTPMGKPLYVDARLIRVGLSGQSIELTRKHRAKHRIPVQRVNRLVVTAADNDMLACCLAIVERGGAVQILNSQGKVCAQLQASEPPVTREVERLNQCIAQRPGHDAYHWWARQQERHAWSLVFRRSQRADFRAGRGRLIAYSRFFRPTIAIEDEAEQLTQLLQAWLLNELYARNQWRIVDTLFSRGHDICRQLRRCLELPLLWRYVRYRRYREQDTPFAASDLTLFFELHSATSVRSQLLTHMDALAYEYRTRKLVDLGP